jgi:hypothetical protein
MQAAHLRLRFQHACVHSHGLAWIAQVKFTPGAPLQGGLKALKVLELADCRGILSMRGRLPALQASDELPNATYIAVQQLACMQNCLTEPCTKRSRT